MNLQFDVQIVWLLLRRSPQPLRRLMLLNTVLVACFGLANLQRIVTLLVVPSNTDFFKSGMVNIWLMFEVAVVQFTLPLAKSLAVSRRLLDDVRAQEEKFSLAFHSAPYGVMFSRANSGQVLEVNQGFERITGFSAPEVVGKTTVELDLWVNPQDRPNMVRELLTHSQVSAQEIPFRKKGGETMIGLYSADLMTVRGEPVILSSLADITELTRLRERLHEQAMHDPLTGLPNRRLLYDQYVKMREQAKQDVDRLALLLIDLDLFKQINDSWGHEVGDTLLVEVGRRLTGCVRAADVVARLGGDEFAILLNAIQNPADAQQIADKVLHSIRTPLDLDGRRLQVGASIGIALFPDHGHEIKELLKRADHSMYIVKAGGKGNYQMYASA